MQIALQDIRILGYKKIVKMYFDTEKVKEEYFESMGRLNTIYNTMKLPAYSLLNKWCLLESLDKDSYADGFSSFIYSIEPMIDLEEPSNSAKRKCRNTWDSMWKVFGGVANLTNYEVTLVRDFSLKSIFILAGMLDENNIKLKKLCGDFNYNISREELEKFINFFNVVLKWAMITQQESNFVKNNLSFVDVLNYLIVLDKEDFEKWLRKLS